MEIKNTSPLAAQNFFKALSGTKTEQKQPAAPAGPKDSIALSSSALRQEITYGIVQNNGIALQKKMTAELKSLDPKKSGEDGKMPKKKEEIGDFVRRIISEINEAVHSPDKYLTDVTFDLEDLKAIWAIDKGKTMKMIRAILDMVDSAQRWKREAAAAGKKLKNVGIKGERKMVDDYAAQKFPTAPGSAQDDTRSKYSMDKLMSALHTSSRNLSADSNDPADKDSRELPALKNDQAA